MLERFVPFLCLPNSSGEDVLRADIMTFMMTAVAGDQKAPKEMTRESMGTLIPFQSLFRIPIKAVFQSLSFLLPLLSLLSTLFPSDPRMSCALRILLLLTQDQVI